LNHDIVKLLLKVEKTRIFGIYQQKQTGSRCTPEFGEGIQRKEYIMINFVVYLVTME